MKPGAEVTGMDTATLQLWFAYPDDLLTEGVARACAALLSEEELARAERFRFDRHRREFLTTRALARTALSHCHPLPPQAWRFKANAHGKPAVEPECGLRFNLSNSAGLVACLIARGAEVGVDVEACARAEEIAELAPRVFSAKEQTQLAELRGPERLRRALSLWTLKEAYIKARGLGLNLPLGRFSFVFGGAEGIRLEVEPGLDHEPVRWQFCLLDHAGHRVALVTERAAGPDLQIWEAHPLPGTPVRLDGVKTAGWS
jgi:4'-phosphopantetheinyl transferase